MIESVVFDQVVDGFGLEVDSTLARDEASG